MMSHGGFSGAEVADINIDHPEGVDPLIYTYWVKVPGYALRDPVRALFFAPAFFQHNTLQRFPNRERLHNIYFDFRLVRAGQHR